jgi:flagellar hook-associated protein 1 FlgK
MAGADILGVGISGLLAFQRELATTGHNISNANTPGYSRQVVDLTAQNPLPASNGYIGTGVQVSSVQRNYDSFLTANVRSATASNSQLQQYYQLASQVDNLLADPTAGLTPSLQRFFDSVQVVANDPTSAPSRQVMLSEANALADRFHYLDQRLGDLRTGVNTQIGSAVNEINSIASGIAAINKQIVDAQGAGGGQPPNDLLDKRDALVVQLAQRVAVTTVPQDDGALNIFIGNGQTLVAGNNASALSVTANTFDPTRSEIGYVVGGATTVITNSITGGSLGAALDFRNQILDTAQNELGRVALGLTSTFNAQHRLGMDANGNINQNFFSDITATSPTATGSTSNTGSGVVAASVTNISALTTSDYRLERTASGYTVTRLSDSTITNLPSFPGSPATVDGVTLSLSSGAISVGDSFLIQPTRRGASAIGVVISSATQIATSAPIRTGEATNANGLPTNLGTGKISAGTVSNTTALPLAANITLAFDPNALGAGVPGFTVTGGPGGTLAYNPATESGGKQFTFPAFGGITFTVSGTPSTADSFVISNNTSGVSDNRNALNLADLRNQLTLANGTATYEGTYGQLVTNVGADTHRAEINKGAQESLLNQVTQARDAVSGVNLDEEAANLVRFQQAYQAAAQVISISATLFQTLLTAVKG